MEIVERGHGDPLVLIPGIQGKWEYLGPALDRLAAFFRVLTFPLCDEPGAEAGTAGAADIDALASQVERVLNARGIGRAAICGVSFGGLVALRFAALHPARTSALILVSTPGPEWHLRPRHECYARMPWLFGPLFLLETPWRLRREIRMAFPDKAGRRRFARQQWATLRKAPLSVSRMATRARLIASHDRVADCAAVTAPTLVVHGDPALDHVVDAEGTSAYGGLIRGARTATIPRTGHLGSITRPDVFADIVRQFLRASRQGSCDSAA